MNGCLLFFRHLLFFPFFYQFLDAASGQKIIIACAGDSLMRPVPLYLRRLLPLTHIAIKEWAQGGLSSATYFSFFQAHPHWRREKVDIILFQLGTNDVSLLLRNEEEESQFINNFKKIIKEFKKIKSHYFRRPRIIIATAPPFAEKKDEAERNRLLEEVVNPAIKKLAREERLILLDQWSRFKDRPDWYHPDGVHPNSEGEKFIARSWSRTIKLVWLSRKVKSYKKFLREFKFKANY